MAKTEIHKPEKVPTSKTNETIQRIRQLGFYCTRIEGVGWVAQEISGDRRITGAYIATIEEDLKQLLKGKNGNGKSALSNGAAPAPAPIEEPDEKEDEPKPQEMEAEEDLHLEKVTENAKGQAYMPGAEPLVPRALNVFVEDHHDAKQQFTAATTRLNEAKAKMEAEAENPKYNKLFKKHPNKPDTQFFDAGKILLLRKDEKVRSYQTVDKDKEDLTPKV